ncbi:MAG: hypothetical protein OEV42_17470 [Deltaproteobacteria bacterium]|nr:hypothetical protein [Deltaproteobacteria bacterium]
MLSPKLEEKNNEYRVAVVPAGVSTFIENEHEVLIENGAGLGSGISDEAYKNTGRKQKRPYKRPEEALEIAWQIIPSSF